MKPYQLIFIAITVMFSQSAMSTGSAKVDLTGISYLQDGKVTNTSDPGIDIVEVVYDLGAQAEGIAIWEISNSSTGTHSNFLVDDWYSKVSWNGLSIDSGKAFSFQDLDIDVVATMVPPNVTDDIPDHSGSSLSHASISVYFSDGSFGRTNLAQKEWKENQSLLIYANAIPEPQTYAMLIVGLGLLGFVARRKKDNS